MNEKVLIVEDEKSYRDLISLFLETEGLRVVAATNGQEALGLFAAERPDLVILDVMLPDMSGFEVCKVIRESSDVPILFLTALGDEDYHLIGYRSGADDYITKPFRSSVLAWKVKLILQRTKKSDKSLLSASGITLNETAFTCTVEGEDIVLTQKEFMVLRELMRHQGRVLTREYLLREIWGFDFDGETRAVDTVITKLRKKLGSMSDLIKTVINVGYKMEENQ